MDHVHVRELWTCFCHWWKLRATVQFRSLDHFHVSLCSCLAGAMRAASFCSLNLGSSLGVGATCSRHVVGRLFYFFPFCCTKREGQPPCRTNTAQLSLGKHGLAILRMGYLKKQLQNAQNANLETSVLTNSSKLPQVFLQKHRFVKPNPTKMFRQCLVRTSWFKPTSVVLPSNGLLDGFHVCLAL